MFSTPDPDALPEHEACTVILQDAFNGGSYDARVTWGQLELLPHPRRKQRDAPARLGFPPDTKSGMVIYRRPDGTVVAKAHRYLLPSGEILGKRGPDPKWMLVGHAVLIVPIDQNGHSCAICTWRLPAKASAPMGGA